MKTYRFTLTPQSAFGTPLVGDTLFGHLCWTIVNRFGEARLTELLAGYTEQRPFMVVSDCFPHGYLPLPTLPSAFWQTDEKYKNDRKKLKKIQWVKIEDAEQQAVKNWQQCAITAEFKFEKASQDQYHNTIDRQTGTTGEGIFAPYATDLTWYQQEQKLDLYIVLDEDRFSLTDLRQVLTDVGSFGFG